MVHVRDALFQETDLNEVQGILILFVTEIRRKKLLDQFLNGSWLRTPAVLPTAVKWLWVSLDRYNMDIVLCLQSATQRQSSHGPYRYSNMQKWVFLLFPTSCHSSLYNSCNKRRVVTSVLLTWEVWGYLRHSIWHLLSKISDSSVMGCTLFGIVQSFEEKLKLNCLFPACLSFQRKHGIKLWRQEPGNAVICKRLCKMQYPNSTKRQTWF